MKTYTVKWTDHVGYTTTVEATSEADAHKQFHAGNIGSIEPCGFCETETDSVEVEQA